MSAAFTPLPDIDEQVKIINSKFTALQKAVSDQQDLTLSRKSLQHEAKKLLQLLEEPNDAVWPRIFQVS